MKNSLIYLPILFTVYFCMQTTNVRAHAVQIGYCTSCDGFLRIWIEHWHSSANPSTTSLDVTLEIDGTVTTISGPPNTSVLDVTADELPGCFTPITMFASCPSKANTYNDWVAYDFSEVPCGKTVTITVTDNENTTVFTMDCGANTSDPLIYPASTTLEIPCNSGSLCATSEQICAPDTIVWCSFGINEIQSYYYSFDFIDNGSFDLDMAGDQVSYVFYGPMYEGKITNCELVNSYSVNMVSGSLDATNTSVNLPFQQGNYILQIIPESTSGNGFLTGDLDSLHLTCEEEEPPCTDCVTSFQPTPGRYIISAWVKEASASQTVTTYENTSIGISFANSTVTYSFIPSGRIIDGWQRIEADFNVPAIAQSIEITLNVTKGDAFFDDIRFFPFDGSMMSYVYDPISLRLMH